MSIIYNIKTFASRIRDKIYYQFRKKVLKLFRDVFSKMEIIVQS